MIYNCFYRSGEEFHGFASVLLGLGSGAAGGRLVAIIPIRPAEDFLNIGIIGISYTFIGICHSGLVFIGILVCFAIFWSKTIDLLRLLKALARTAWICISFTRFWLQCNWGTTGGNNTNQNTQRLPKHVYESYDLHFLCFY